MSSLSSFLFILLCRLLNETRNEEREKKKIKTCSVLLQLDCRLFLSSLFPSRCKLISFSLTRHIFCGPLDQSICSSPTSKSNLVACKDAWPAALIGLHNSRWGLVFPINLSSSSCFVPTNISPSKPTSPGCIQLLWRNAVSSTADCSGDRLEFTVASTKADGYQFRLSTVGLVPVSLTARVRQLLVPDTAAQWTRSAQDRNRAPAYIFHIQTAANKVWGWKLIHFQERQSRFLFLVLASSCVSRNA